MDNLIAEKKARPMLVVMEGVVARKPGEPDAALRGPLADPTRRFLTLDEVFITDLVPMVDRTYRTINDGAHRALAGLSVGAMQAFTIGLRHPQHFASLGGFSGAAGITELSDGVTSLRGLNYQADGFAPPAGLLFLSVGTDEPEWMLNSVKRYRDTLQAAGIEHVFYESRDTGHEWHTWRRSLREFASLLFKG